MTDQELKDTFDRALKRGLVLCILGALLCATAALAEHLGRVL